MADDNDKPTFDALIGGLRKDYPEIVRAGFQRISSDRVVVHIETGRTSDTPTVALRVRGTSLEDSFARLRSQIAPTPDDAA